MRPGILKVRNSEELLMLNFFRTIFQNENSKLKKKNYLYNFSEVHNLNTKKRIRPERELRQQYVELQQNRDALVISEQRYKLIVEGANDGICYDFASLFAGMLRSIGIPAKLVKGYADNIDGYHAWNEVYIKETDEWITIDTSFDAQMKKAGKTFKMIKDSGDGYSKLKVY
jgi:hypothetical protein